MIVDTLEQSVVTFMEQGAKTFEARDWEGLLSVFEVPTSVYIAGQMLVIKDLTRARYFLEIYRSNLDRQGYLRTVTGVRDVKISRGTPDFKAQVKTSHFDTDDKLMIEIDYAIFGVVDRTGMRIKLVETLSMPNPENLKGLPLY